MLCMWAALASSPIEAIGPLVSLDSAVSKSITISPGLRAATPTDPEVGAGRTAEVVKLVPLSRLTAGLVIPLNPADEPETEASAFIFKPSIDTEIVDKDPTE